MMTTPMENVQRGDLSDPQKVGVQFLHNSTDCPPPVAAASVGKVGGDLGVWKLRRVRPDGDQGS